MTAVGRQKTFDLHSPKLRYYTVPSIDASTDYADMFNGVDVVVHLAARVH